MIVLATLIGGLLAGVLRSLGGRGGHVRALVFSVPACLAPAMTILDFGSHAAPEASRLTLIFALGLAGGLLLLPRGARTSAPLEAELLRRPRTLHILVLSALAAVLTQLVMLSRVGLGSGAGVYELNVALAQDDVASFGLLGRINRLALPLGLVSMALGMLHPERRGRRVYVALALVFLLSLVGPRRSLVFYQAVGYGIIWLIHRQQERPRATFTRWARIAVAVACLVGFFGYVQVGAKKSEESSVWASGISDGLRYVSGNLPYAECIIDSQSRIKQWSSFPALERILMGDAEAGSKPFCRLPDGSLFNTSPGYVDVGLNSNSDVAVGVWGFGLALLYSILQRRRRPSVALQAALLTVVAFQFRENLLGQLDYLQCCLTLAVVAAVASGSIRRRGSVLEQVRAYS